MTSAKTSGPAWTGWVLLGTSILLETTGQLCFKLAATGAGSGSAVGLEVAGEAATSGWAAAGYVAMALQLPVWIQVLARLDLSLAFPLASLTQVAILAVSIVLLGERVTAQHLAGVTAILLGSMLIASEAEAAGEP